MRIASSVALLLFGTRAVLATELPAGSCMIGVCHDSDPLCYCSSSLDLDVQQRKAELPGIELLDNSRHIYLRADQASGLGLPTDQRDSHWVLTGHVLLRLPEGQLQADRAIVEIRRRQITSVAASGAPVELTVDRIPNRTLVLHGHANAVDFDAAKNDLSMQGASWVSDGCNDIASEQIHYELATQHIHAEPADGERVVAHSRNAKVCADATEEGAPRAAAPAP